MQTSTVTDLLDIATGPELSVMQIMSDLDDGNTFIAFADP